MNEEFLTDEELLEHIKHCLESYKGDITHLNEAVGLLVVGRMLGWEHQRLITPRASWTWCIKVFGDPKRFGPKRTVLGERKSQALHVVDKLNAAGQLLKGYIDVVQGKVTIPKDQRKQLVEL